MHSLLAPPDPLALDAPARGRFLAYCQHHRYPSRAQVFGPGESGHRVFFVVSGRLAIVAPGQGRRELVLGRAGPGDFVGEIGVFLPTQPRSVVLRALESSEVAHIDADRLAELLRTDLADDAARLLYAMATQLSRRLVASSRKARGLALMDVSARIWHALEELAEEPGAMTHPKGIQVKVSRQDLARMAGCSREMAGRVIRQFVEQGRMDAHGKTMVLFR